MTSSDTAIVTAEHKHTHTHTHTHTHAGMAVISFDRSEYDISGRSNLVAMVIGKNLQEQINITIVTSNDTGQQ